MSKKNLVLEILCFLLCAAVAFLIPGVLAWNDALAITPSSDPFFAANCVFGFTVYFGAMLVAVGGVAAVVTTASDITCPAWMVPAILAITPNLAHLTANKAKEENPIPLFIAAVAILGGLAALLLFPVTAFAATTTAMEPVMSIEITHLKLAFFFACTFAALAFAKERVLNRKIANLVAELKIEKRRADRAEAHLDEANACIETSTAGDLIAKLKADNAQLTAQTTWLSTLANNLSKTVVGVATALVALFIAMPAHAAAPWQFAADAGQLPDILACCAICALVCGSISAVIIGIDILCRKIIATITTSAKTAIALETAMPVLTLFVLAIIGLAIALFPSCANAATSITMNNDGLTINVMDSTILSYLAWIVGSSLIAVTGAVLCEVIVRYTRTIAKHKAAAAAKKAEMFLIVQEAAHARENARLDAWYDRAEYAVQLNQLDRDARIAVLRGKPYHTNQSVASAADKACGYRRALLTRTR